jgi:type I restriction enzyme R subunit
MPSNKETLFQDHICKYLEDNHQYKPIDKTDISNSEYHINENHLIQFIKDPQEEKYNQIAENFGTDTDKEIIKAVINELGKNKPLWLIIRNGVDVKGVKLELYKPKPRSKTSQNQQISYEKNILSFKKEYKAPN